jgi:hypothetical protein
MKKFALTLSIAAAAAFATIAMAGPGFGAGYGPGAGCAAGTSANCPAGMGPGAGPGSGRMGGWGRGMGVGFELMTPEERAAHRDYMRSLKTVEECTAYVAAHQAAMAARAAEKGITLPQPQVNMCERMQARGRFN